MKSIISLAFIMMIFTGLLYGQGGGYHEDVIVIKPYNPMVDDAFKININPVISDTSVSTRVEIKYSISPIKLTTDIEIAPIKAARMRGMPQTELYRFFLKSGFGNYTTPYFEVFYNSLRSNQSGYGIHYRHMSGNGKLGGHPFPGYSENTFDANATLFGKKQNFRFRGEYDRDVVHFYGGFDSLRNNEIDKDLIRQRFHQLTLDAGMESNHGRSDELNHGLSLKYRLINDLFETTEHHIQGGFFLRKDVTWFEFSRYQTAGIDIGADFFNSRLKMDTTIQPFNQALVRLNPYMSTKIKDLDIRLGGVLGYESGDNGKLWFFPDVNLRISLKEHKFLIIGGLDGNAERSSFSSLAEVNPYIISNPELRNTVTKIQVFGGIRTAIGSRINFTARVSSESVKDMVMFIPDTMVPEANRFKVIYDDASVLSVKGEITFQLAEKIKIGGKILFQDYNLQNELYAWHKPSFTSGIDIRYNLEDKIIAYAGLNYITGIKVPLYINGVTEMQDLSDILDINFGVEYRYSKLLSGFARLNNLAASRYYRWQTYPTYMFNFMLGITYAL